MDRLLAHHFSLKNLIYKLPQLSYFLFSWVLVTQRIIAIADCLQESEQQVMTASSLKNTGYLKMAKDEITSGCDFTQ